MTQINPYLNFNGNCREVMTFYQDCLAADLTLQTIEGSPLEDQCPAAMKKQILHAVLQKGSVLLMASDMIGPDGFNKGNNFSLSLNCSTEDEIETIFANLSQGGQVTHPLAKQFWGGTFGVLTDKYGIKWILNYDKGFKA
jgi:PhnB protein